MERFAGPGRCEAVVDERCSGYEGELLEEVAPVVVDLRSSEDWLEAAYGEGKIHRAQDDGADFRSPAELNRKASEDRGSSGGIGDVGR